MKFLIQAEDYWTQNLRMALSSMKKTWILAAFVFATMAGVTGNVESAFAQRYQQGGRPALTITNQPLPPELATQVYSQPSLAPVITPSQISGASYYAPTKTIVSRKIEELEGDLSNLQKDLSMLSGKLSILEKAGQNASANYYADVATISTQLRSGTTPGNPRLIQRLSNAQNGLESLASNVAELNDLAVEIASVSSVSSFLLDAVRATYSLSGAVEEDHVRLAQLEDSINNTLVLVDRLQNNVNDDITRTAAYLTTERSNLRTLSLAIANGDLYGKSLAARPFSSVPLFNTGIQNVSTAPRAPMTSGPSASAPSTSGYIPASIPPAQVGKPKPLVKIRFDKVDVQYEQPVYMAVTKALEQYPNARFEIVAVHPNVGNAAQVAIESTRSRRNAEEVLRTLTQMGLDLSRIDLSYSPSATAKTNEVHIYIR